MRTKLMLNAAVKFLLIGVLAFSIFPRLSAAQSDKVQLSVSMLTASHAAVGASMTYQLVLINEGSRTARLRANVELVDPNGTSFTLLSTQYKLTRDQTEVASAAFETSSFTNQTGTFTLRGFTIDVVSGDVIDEQDLALTVVPVPDDFIYASIGGQGPASARLGYTADYQTVVANLGTGSANLKTNTTLILVDGTEVPLTKSDTQNYSAGTNIITAQTVTPSQYSVTPGTYSVRVDVYDTANNLLATDTFAFTRTPLPAKLYPPAFTDTATQAGVNIPRSVVTIEGCGVGRTDVMSGGAGIAVADYDGDGLEDVYVVDMKGIGHLWRNQGNDTFIDNAGVAGIPYLLRQSGASFADIDNDGDPDLLLLPSGGQLMLLHNLGNGTFANVTPGSGLATPADQNFVGATWGDYDNDGFLDLYVASHVDCAEENGNDHLFHNGGNLTFSDVTDLVGGSGGVQVNARTLVPVFVDYNGDGLVDLYCGTDVGRKYGPNVLWRNDGPDDKGGWIFTDVSAEAHADVAMSAMGIAVGDYARKGTFNFLVTNVKDNILLQKQSDDTFVQVQGNGVGGAHVARPTVPGGGGRLLANAVTWNTAFYDFNNDAWEDLYMAGGPIDGKVVNPNAFLLNNRDGTFLDLSLLAGVTGASGNMPGTSFADFNQDGFMDIFQEGADNGSPHLYMNNARALGNPNHWLEVKLVGTTSNRDAVGAQLLAKIGEAELRRWVFNTGFQGNSTLIQHFGLGSGLQVDSLVIIWPSGNKTTLRNVQADQRITITE